MNDREGRDGGSWDERLVAAPIEVWLLMKLPKVTQSHSREFRLQRHVLFPRQQFPPYGFSSEKTLVLISHFANPSPKMLLWTSRLNTWTDGVTHHGAFAPVKHGRICPPTPFFKSSTAISPRFPTRGPATSKSPWLTP